MRSVIAATAAVVVTVGALTVSGSYARHLASTSRLSVQIESPTGPVTIIENGSIPIQLKVSGITLDPNAMGRRNVAGHGHLHFYVDCIPSVAYSRPNNLGACWAGAFATTRTAFDLTTSHVPVKPGTHVLLIALARNDHILYPAAPAALSFTVIRPALNIRVLSPTRPVTVSLNGKIPLRLKISGITLDAAAMGRANVPGYGHFHFYVDCIPSVSYTRPNNLGACWAGAAARERTVFDLATSHVKVNPGTHVLLLALSRNDHVLYRAPIASVVFTVNRR